MIVQTMEGYLLGKERTQCLLLTFKEGSGAVGINPSN